MATIAARVADKNAAIRAALKGTAAADNKDVIAAFADGWSVAESQRGAGRHGGMPPKKAVKEDPPPPPADAAAPTPPPSIPAAARRAVANTAEFANQVGRAGADAAARAIIAAPLVLAAGGGGALALNNPTMFGNIVDIVANVLASGTDAAIRSTWGDWGQAVLQVGNAVGVLGSTAVAQSIQGPVVPFTIAAAALAFASGGSTSNVVNMLGRMSLFVKNTLPKVLPGRPRTDDASTLMELAEIAKKSAPGGAGADAISATVRALGAPAVRGGPAGVETVAAAAERELKVALKKIARRPFRVDPGARSREASAAAAVAAARAAAAEEAERVRLREKEIAERFPASATGMTEAEEAEERARARAAPPRQTSKRPAPEPAEDEEEDTGAGTGLKKARPDSDGKSEGGRRRKTKKSKTKRRVTRRKACTVVKFVY